jgi:hypothetical protein
MCVLALILLSRGLVALTSRLVERRIRRLREEGGDGRGDGGRGGHGRRGGDGAELVLAA